MSGMTPSSIPPRSPALRSFEAQWLARGEAREGDPLADLRENAMKRVLRLGLPTTRDESFRYTNTRSLTSHGYEDAPHSIPESCTPRRRYRC